MNTFRTLHATATALATLAVLVALAIVAACAHDTHPTTAPATTSALVPVLDAVPAGLVWRDYQGVAVPAANDGPADPGAVTATGFTRTPPGAGLAAINHLTRLSLATDEHWTQIAAREIAVGPGKDAWVTSRALLSITGPAGPAQAPRIRGYTITGYTPDRATVDIYTVYPDASRTVTTTEVVWIGGDWQLLLPNPADTEPRIHVATTADPAVTFQAPR